MIIISIIIPTYGRVKYLERAINSIGNCHDLEIIVVDDNIAGSDLKLEVRQICKRLGKLKNIIYLDLLTNYGAALARNRGVEIAKGKYISFLDDDDVYYPNKILLEQSCIKKLEPDLIYSKAKNFGKLVNFEFDKKHLLKMQLIKSVCTTSSITIKKSYFKEINGFNNIKSSQESELLLRVFSDQNAHIHFIDEVLIERFIDTEESISKRTRSGITSYLTFRLKYLDTQSLLIKAFVISTVIVNFIIIQDKKSQKLILYLLFSINIFFYILSKIYIRLHAKTK